MSGVGWKDARYGEGSEPVTFGIDAFTLDDRMRLFHFLAADKRVTYLWVLRAFDRARSNYQVLLHTTDVAAQLAVLDPGMADVDDLPAVLDRSSSGATSTVVRRPLGPRRCRSTATGTRSTS